MSFLFASSHLPETRVQRPKEEEEKDVQPRPSSGGVRAFSHLPQYAPSVVRSAGTPPPTQPGNANLSHTQTLEYRTPDAQPGSHAMTLEHQTPDAQPGSHAMTLEYEMPHDQPPQIGSYQGGKRPNPTWQPHHPDILKPKPASYLPDWLKPDTDHEDDPSSHEPPDLSPPLKPAPPNPRIPAFVIPEWLQRQIDIEKKRPTHPDDDTPGWHPGTEQPPPLKPAPHDPRIPAFVIPEWLQHQIDIEKKRPTHRDDDTPGRHPGGHSPGLRDDVPSPHFPNPFGPSRNPKRRRLHPGFDRDPDQKPLPEGWKPQLLD